MDRRAALFAGVGLATTACGETPKSTPTSFTKASENEVSTQQLVNIRWESTTKSFLVNSDFARSSEQKVILGQPNYSPNPADSGNYAYQLMGNRVEGPYYVIFEFGNGLSFSVEQKRRVETFHHYHPREFPKPKEVQVDRKGNWIDSDGRWVELNADLTLLELTEKYALLENNYLLEAGRREAPTFLSDPRRVAFRNAWEETPQGLKKVVAPFEYRTLTMGVGPVLNAFLYKRHMYMPSSSNS